MPKPAGTTGATKMKILAVICHNNECGQESYGYDIWKRLKDQFHIYLDDNDIGNVYHHLNDLCERSLITRADEGPDGRCFYKITEQGLALRQKYTPYINIMKENQV